MIIKEGDPRLRRPARAVELDEFGEAPLRDLVVRLWQTLDETPGVGLAAAQLGDDRAVAVVEDKDEFHATIEPQNLRAQERVVVPPYVLINPRIEAVGSETTFFFEGCLSVVNRAAVVERARTVKVTWTDEDSETRTRTVGGWHARILQHEVDHLRGILFVDKAHPNGIVSKAEFMERWRGASPDEIRQLIGE